MERPAQLGSVQTVLGLVPPEELGTTLMHEHILSDLSQIAAPPSEASERELFYQPLSHSNVGLVRFYSRPNADSMRLSDIPTAIEELNLYRQYGGSSVVEVSSLGLGRDPVGLARISRATGVHIIMGSSYYVDAAHPPDMDSRSETEIADEILQDVVNGVGSSDIRSGIIGEVGCSWPLTSNERKVLRASAKAQRQTGAAITIHPGRDERSPEEVLEVLEKAGGNLQRTIIGHLERTVFEWSRLRDIANRGCYLQWDHFAYERSYFPNNPRVDLPSDAGRMELIARMIGEGFGEKILISHDVASKDKLLKYGGHGYFYILLHILPRMRARGFTEENIHRILVRNPAEALSFVEPVER